MFESLRKIMNNLLKWKINCCTTSVNVSVPEVPHKKSPHKRSPKRRKTH